MGYGVGIFDEMTITPQWKGEFTSRLVDSSPPSLGPSLAGGGGGGAIMYSSMRSPYPSSSYDGYGGLSTSYQPYYGGPSAFAVPTSYYGGGGGGSYHETEEERKIRQKNERLIETKRQREERLRKANQRLDNMPEWRKAIVRKAIKILLWEEEVKEAMTGVKWFVIFLGLAIFLNFPRILSIIELIVKK